MEIKIIRAGMQATVQDLGRTGHRAEGVPASGAMDSCALRIANALVGNPENAAAIEFAFVGPTLAFSEDTWVALGGAECEGLPSWRLHRVPVGAALEIGPCVRGCRGYLAVSGGIDVPMVLGSRSTYLRGGFGGFEGRALRKGDVLRTLAGPGVSRELGGGSANWRIDPRVLPPYSSEPTVRVVEGVDADVGRGWIEEVFRVSPQSDRMGLRLKSERPLTTNRRELLSTAVAPGTVQLPPDGQLLVLMADAQTIGGYPQIAHVISVDLPLLAQLRPGDRVRFSVVNLEEAHRLALAREHALSLLKQGLAEKLGGEL